MKAQSNRTSTKVGHRRSNSRHNGGTNGLGGRASPAATSTRGSSSDSTTTWQVNSNEDQGDNRLILLIAKSQGKPCVATTTDGSRYRGLLLGTDMWTSGSHSSISVVIKQPQLVSKSLINEKNNLDKLPEQLVIQAKDLIDLEVDINISEPIKHYIKEEFKTDADITNSRDKVKTFEERELVKWEPEEEEGLQKLTLEDEVATRNGNSHWDQFKVNEEKFGVESTYDEHLYTTRIDKSAPDYEQRLAKANQIAAEIEGQTTTDRHILEERGIQVDDSGMDEEDKYSGVDRRGNELMAALKMNSKASQSEQTSTSSQDPSKYVTPRQRAANYHNDPAIVSSSAAKKNDKKAPDSVPAKPPVPNEAFRLNAESEIYSLRQFSANFKIPHKMPQDLLPILAKDKLKQDEILKKQQQEQEEKKQEERQKQEAEEEKQKALQVSSEKPTPSVVGPGAVPSPAPVASPHAPSDSSVPQSTPSRPQVEKKMSKTFKLNPNAASFTPSLPHNTLTSPPKAVFNNQVPVHSPHSVSNRTYSSNSSSQGSTKRHYQISAQDFFGGANKVPTQEKQAQKLKNLKTGFNMFNTTKSKAEDASSVVYERTFQTPPTWDATIEETHEALFPRPMFKSPSFMPSPMIATTAAPMPYNFQMPPQPQFPQQVAPIWFVPPPQNFGMMPNPYQNGQPGRRFK
ncbi:mRNA polyadenylation regulating protein [Candida orthopsilosis Co 90-125]|uniref:mRNA polyadenylation regulating protein n=1 Tax=Candida orthopsilosis (strain 90-125) TaxID=1136231 RepID=H8X6I2_CANO9|nr:mRNA polyadenylation regulating protein [Candida orthopsilosis Co 90-125]CCG23593.1 mRNA polyadenylation regulating protein [Candida orthopsilosis Co 90-125]